MQFPRTPFCCPLAAPVNQIHLRKSVVVCFKSYVNLSKDESFTPNLILQLDVVFFFVCFLCVCFIDVDELLVVQLFDLVIPSGIWRNSNHRNSLASWRPMVSLVMVMPGACGSPYPLWITPVLPVRTMSSHRRRNVGTLQMSSCRVWRNHGPWEGERESILTYQPFWKTGRLFFSQQKKIKAKFVWSEKIAVEFSR